MTKDEIMKCAEAIARDHTADQGLWDALEAAVDVTLESVRRETIDECEQICWKTADILGPRGGSVRRGVEGCATLIRALDENKTLKRDD